MADTLPSLNTSLLKNTPTGYDQTIQQYTDAAGNVYTPNYGGEMNTLMGYTGAAKLGNANINANYDAAGNFTGGYGTTLTNINGKDYGTQYDASGKATYFVPQTSGLLADLAPVIGMVAMAFGAPMLGNLISTTTGLTGASLAAATGATMGAGTAALTGQDIAKGAVLGGAAGWAGNTMFGPSTTTTSGLTDAAGNAVATPSDFFPIGGAGNANLTPAALESGLGTPGYGFNAGAAASGLFNPDVIGAGANQDFSLDNINYSNEGRNYPTPDSTQGTGGSPVNASTATTNGLPFVPVTPGVTTGGGTVTGGGTGGGFPPGSLGGGGTGTGTTDTNWAGLAAGLYDMYAKNKMADAWQAQLDKVNKGIEGLYAPGSPEYQALWQDMSRKDAAAGRNSQYGVRAVDLAGKIAPIKTNAMVQSLGPTTTMMQNQLSNQYGGLNSLFYGAGSNNALNTAINSGVNSLVNTGVDAAKQGLSSLADWVGG